jgi:2'-5' RNA ligase
MRLFVAVVLGEAIERRATEALGRLKPLAPKARWVRPEGMHLTLAFLGEVDPELLPALREALTGVARRHAPFVLTVEGGGSFGAASHPRVLWADVKGQTEALGALQADVAATLEPLGFERERRAYTAHLTLARAKLPRGDAAFVACVQELRGAAWGEGRVDRVLLYESRNGRYIAQVEAPLTGEAAPAEPPAPGP